MEKGEKMLWEGRARRPFRVGLVVASPFLVVLGISTWALLFGVRLKFGPEPTVSPLFFLLFAPFLATLAGSLFLARRAFRNAASRYALTDRRLLVLPLGSHALLREWPLTPDFNVAMTVRKDGSGTLRFMQPDPYSAERGDPLDLKALVFHDIADVEDVHRLLSPLIAKR